MRLFPSVVLAFAPAVTMDDASSLSLHSELAEPNAGSSMFGNLFYYFNDAGGVNSGGGTVYGAPRPCSVCGSPRLCQRRERRLIGARFGRWREERFGRARCLTLRYCLLLSLWVDPSPSAEHTSTTLGGGGGGDVTGHEFGVGLGESQSLS